MNRWIALACGLAGVCLAIAAQGAGYKPNPPIMLDITTTSGQCLEENGARTTLTLDGTGSGGSIGFCEGKNDDGTDCVAVIGAKGTTVIAAGGNAYWPAGTAPSSQFCFVAATDTLPLTIRHGEH